MNAEQTTTTTTQATSANGSPAPEQATTGKKAKARTIKPKSPADKESALAYATRAEAEAHKPDRSDYRMLHIVFAEDIKAGTEVYTWCNWLACPTWLADMGATAAWADAKQPKPVTTEDAIGKLLADGIITEAQAEKMRAKASK